MGSTAVCVFLCLMTTARSVSGKVDFCFEKKFPDLEPGSKLQFTKELSGWEYAVDSKFKSLHCCAKGYRSIEWYKDGRAYPWPGDVSSFILYPESANQTIYTQALKASDAGNYTCRVHNDTSHVFHQTELTVYDTDRYMDKPLANYRPPTTSYAIPRRQTRLFCEAFVGHINLPDATSEASWAKVGEHSLDASRVHVEQVHREDGQVIGAYLTIDSVQPSDFGSYICTISNTVDKKIIMETQLRGWPPARTLCFLDEMKLVASTISLGLGLLLFALILIYLSFKMLFKYRKAMTSVWGKVTEKSPFSGPRGKRVSLVIVYGEGDRDFVESVLLPTLRKRDDYNLFPRKITNERVLSEETFLLMNKVGKAVIVLSRSVTKEWTQLHVITTLQALVTIEHHIIISMETLPERIKEANNLFDFESLIKRYKVIVWPEDQAGSIAFWTSLEEQLPKVTDECVKPTTVNIGAEQKDGHKATGRTLRPNDIPEVHV